MSGETPAVREALPVYEVEALETERIPPGYRQTEVGVIPEDWEVENLASLGAGSIPPIKAGPFGSSLTKNTYVSSGYKIYGQEQVIRGDYQYGNYFVSAAKLKELESCSVKPGDILLSLVGTAGKLLVIPHDAPEGIINPRLIRFSFDKERVDSEFFKELFGADQIQSYLERYAQGGTMGVLNASILRAVSIPLPPLHEQCAIAAALSDVDALISALDRLIAKKRALKTAAMQQLLTGNQRLPGFSGEWETKRLGDFAEINSGGTPSSNITYYYDGSIPWVSITDMTKRGKYVSVTDRNLTEKGLANSAARMFPKGTVLYAMYASIGECSIADVELSSSQAILGIRPSKSLNTDYLYFLLISRKEAVQSLGQQGTQANLNAGIVKGFSVPVPPLEEQTAIAAVLSDMDAEIEALEARREKTRQVKQGMMQELLTGRTRLV